MLRGRIRVNIIQSINYFHTSAIHAKIFFFKNGLTVTFSDHANKNYRKRFFRGNGANSVHLMVRTCMKKRTVNII